MLYMIQIWCPSHPPTPPMRFPADLQQIESKAYLFTPHQAGQAPQHPWSILLVSALVIIGDNGPTAGNRKWLYITYVAKDRIMCYVTCYVTCNIGTTQSSGHCIVT